MKTGHDVVDEISKLNFEGNIVPNTWYSHIKRKTVKEKYKTDLLAVNILADIIYWYRASEERDEASGKTIKFKKKFKEDMYQKWYHSWEEMFGVTKRQLRDSIRTLIKLNLIRREIRTVKPKNGGVITGVTFFEPIPKTIEYINNSITDDDRPLYEIVYTPPQNCKGVITKLEGGHDNFVPHTENTTKIPTKNTTDTCTADCKQSSDVGGNVSMYPMQENPFLKDLKNILENKKYEKLKNTKNKNIGDINKFNRRQIRKGIKFQGEEISAALIVYNELDCEQHPLLCEYIEHETKLWDFTATKNPQSVKAQFILECLYCAPIFEHFCKLRKNGDLDEELRYNTKEDPNELKTLPCRKNELLEACRDMPSYVPR